MHRNKHKPKTVETREASEAVKSLTASVGQHIAELQRRADTLLAELGAVALRDAKLDPADGWQYNVDLMKFTRTGARG